MAAFIHIGMTWLNVERIVAVEVKPGTHGDVLGCRVVFTDGQKDLSPDEAKVLLDFLKRHGAG